MKWISGQLWGCSPLPPMLMMIHNVALCLASLCTNTVYACFEFEENNIFYFSNYEGLDECHTSVVLDLFGDSEPHRFHTCFHHTPLCWKKEMYFFLQFKTFVYTICRIDGQTGQAELNIAKHKSGMSQTAEPLKLTH